MKRLKDIKMKPKLIGLFLAVGLIPLALAGWWAEESRSIRSTGSSRSAKAT